MTGDNIAALEAYQEQHRNGREPASVLVPDDKLTTRMSDIETRSIRWAWHGRVQLEVLTVWTGEEGLGKSVFAAWLAAQATRGKLEGDWHGKPIDVLVLAGEDGLGDTWAPRLAVADADLKRVHALKLEALPITWNICDGIDDLRRAVRASGAKLVVIDALLEHLPPASGGENINSAQYVRAALTPLRRLAEELGIAIIFSLHPPKARGHAFRDFVQGSQAFSAIARSGLLFGWHPDDAEDDPLRRRVLIRGKGNHERIPPAITFRVVGKEYRHTGDGVVGEREVVVDVEPSDVTFSRLTARGGSDESRSSKSEETVDILRERLSDGEWHASKPILDGLEALDLKSGSVVTRAKQLAGVESRKTASQWEWRIPKTPAKNPTPPITIQTESWPENTPNPQCSPEESKIPSQGTTEPWQGGPGCNHDTPRWRVTPSGMWLCDACYPHPQNSHTIEWDQQHALTEGAA